MKIGFTGTRHGMTDYQKQEVRWWLEKKNPTEAHHGDCVGADADFHGICNSLGIPVRGHPPSNSTLRAFCEFSLGMESEKPYLERNKAIVDAVDFMIATPATVESQPKSGTWQTIRYAHNSEIPTLVIYPQAEISKLVIDPHNQEQNE